MNLHFPCPACKQNITIHDLPGGKAEIYTSLPDACPHCGARVAEGYEEKYVFGFGLGIHKIRIYYT